MKNLNNNIHNTRNERENGITSTDDLVDVLLKGLHDRIKKNKERYITQASSSFDKPRTNRKNNKYYKTEIRKTNIWILQTTNYIAQVKSWKQQLKGNRKKESEYLLIEAENKILTNKDW